MLNSASAFNRLTPCLAPHAQSKPTHTAYSPSLPVASQEVLRAADVNGDGQITLQEFLAATLNLQRLEPAVLADQLVATFRAFDTDGSGTLSKKELAEVGAGGGGVDDGLSVVVVAGAGAGAGAGACAGACAGAGAVAVAVAWAPVWCMYVACVLHMACMWHACPTWQGQGLVRG
jgi:hypothetical protein